MNPGHVKSFVTYYIQNLSERTRRERAGTKWGIDWIAYNIGLARFGKPMRLPFLRHGTAGFPKSKTEAEFGVDVAFVSGDGTELVVFVLKDEPLTNKTWTANDFERDLRMAMTPDLSADGLEDAKTVTVILAYNKDDHQNGIVAYDRFVAAAPSKVGDQVELRFARWTLLWSTQLHRCPSRGLHPRVRQVGTTAHSKLETLSERRVDGNRWDAWAGTHPCRFDHPSRARRPEPVP
jgi:hypothetical protein